MGIYVVRASAVILASLIVGCSSTWKPSMVMTTPVVVLEQIRRVYPSVSLAPNTMINIVGLTGQYSDSGPAKLKRVGGVLSGSTIYLLKNSSYVCVGWSDLQPAATNEIGRWEICKGFIHLRSDWTDPDSEPLEDHVYLPLILSDTNRLILLGNRYAYSYYLEHGKDNPHDPEFMLILRAFERIQGDTEIGGRSPQATNEATR